VSSESVGRLTIAVLTYDRTIFLPALLADLDREAGLAAGEVDDVEILVVDNDPGASARSTVSSVPTAAPVRYVVEAQRGIAAARNRALDECGAADVLVFLDDDERPDGGWLVALVRTYLHSRPAAVGGPVRTQYLGDPDPWALSGRFVDRSHRDGVRTGQEVPEAATNNLLLDLHVVRRLDLRFDESLGLGGGEDSLFTRQLTRSGGRIVWCAEAWVTDLRPGDRTTRRALLRRAYSFSNAAVTVRLKLAPPTGAGRLAARVRAVAAGSARMVAGGGWVAGGALTRRSDRVANGARLLARGAGAVTGGVGVRHEEYRGARPTTRAERRGHLGRQRATSVLIANPSPDVYGSDLQMLESISAMTAQGWRVMVALPRAGELVPRIEARGGEVHLFGYPVLRRANQSVAAFASMAGSAALAVPRLVGLIRRLRPSLVYVNTVTLPWWLLASRLTGTPTLCHLHEAENIDSRLVRRALIAPLRLAHAVIVISRSAIAAMVEADPGLERKGRLIYNGVPTPPEEPSLPERAAPLRAVVVGRLSPRKAPHLALEAVGRLRQQGVELEIELVGSAFPGYEWYVEELKQRAAQADLAGAVTFAGYTSPIWPALQRADLAIAPSLREPFGNAVVEAQLSLRPVVATAALGHLETITDGETGLLVPAEDVGAMAAAIRRVVEDGDLATTLAENARRNAQERFTTDRYNAEIVALVGALTAGAMAR
jgi:glycosyltransferase involved in cell wall biosynthesis